MSVNRTNKTPIEAQLAVSVPIEVYEPKLKSELNKYRQTANMRGFRKGKVPMSVIRKMYGKAMLADVVNKLVQEELGDYLKEEDLNLLGQPLPAEDQKVYDFDINSLEDFEFRFDIGLEPEFKVVGLSKEESFDQFVVNVEDEMIDRDLEAARKKTGKEVHPESDFEESDRLTFNARELDGDVLKNKGFETAFSLLLSDVADPSLREEIKGKAIGDKVRFDIFTLEGEREESYVRKYLLNLEEDEMDREVGSWYEATIVEASRIEPADLDEEFFKKAYGEEVTTEEQAREVIKGHIQSYYDAQSEALLFRDFQTRLIDLNPLELPEDFLKRWLVASNEDLALTQVEKDYPDFSQSLAWNLIEKNIISTYDLKVDPEEVREAFKKQLLNYLGNVDLPEESMNRYIDEMMRNRESVQKVYQDKISDKVFETIRDQVILNPVSINVKDFEEKVKEARAASQEISNEEE